MSIMKNHDFSGWPRLTERGKDALVIGLTIVSIYFGSRFYCSLKDVPKGKFMEQPSQSELNVCKPKPEQIRH